jgi:dual specificity protein kinase YAK1
VHFCALIEYTLLIKKKKKLLIFCRGQPPDYVLKEAKNTSKFFKCIGSVHNIEHGEVSTNGRSPYQALTEEEYEAVSVHINVF